MRALFYLTAAIVAYTREDPFDHPTSRVPISDLILHPIPFDPTKLSFPRSESQHVISTIHRQSSIDACNSYGFDPLPAYLEPSDWEFLKRFVDEFTAIKTKPVPQRVGNQKKWMINLWEFLTDFQATEPISTNPEMRKFDVIWFTSCINTQVLRPEDDGLPGRMIPLMCANALSRKYKTVLQACSTIWRYFEPVTSPHRVSIAICHKPEKILTEEERTEKFQRMKMTDERILDLPSSTDGKGKDELFSRVNNIVTQFADELARSRSQGLSNTLHGLEKGGRENSRSLSNQRQITDVGTTKNGRARTFAEIMLMSHLMQKELGLSGNTKTSVVSSRSESNRRKQSK
ncbi:hypothetical protein NEOLI_000323 [Neolecta irregularis DAH-3]|uniref:Uncharacterized protein n=1 Tax=Neolecta irregularis (strain DAH-3) TaxID=1198029 RepID=A0A1U7LVW8_NEOID|nr:hypothetical protein NEOLI_000323 [Neolecta irregularis DAH-3]|eukprot:OLL26692.1 hypothetical protein NEOLI_000323 [Neolecta irregularis DAH-3]